MRVSGTPGIAAVGAGLIAVTYGLARFAFGLFLPAIRSNLGLTTEQMGVIGALPFASFALASLFAPTIAVRLGARNAAVTASGLALVGLALVSRAEGVIALAAGVFTCGISTGLMMPALATGVRAAVQPSLQGRVTAIMNAGTSVGVTLSVPAVLLLADAWRAGYLSFAALAAIGLIAAWCFVPSASRAPAADRPPLSAICTARWAALLRLVCFAFGMGVVSAMYWVFAPDLVMTVGGGSTTTTGWLWLMVGIAGLAGAAAGDLCDHHGSQMTQAIALLALAASVSLVAASPGQFVIALASAAVFGVSYMTLTGLYLLGGVRLLSGRPSLGAVLPFLGVGIGQAVGSPLAGLAVNRLGYEPAFAVFALVALALAAASPLYPGHRRHDDRAEDDDGGTEPRAGDATTRPALAYE